jgi:stalled ribosome rescue protein Dom34
MTSRNHAVVWIDHREARVFHFDREGVEKMVIHPDKPSRHIHHKANTIGSGHSPEDRQYLEQVTAAISDAQAILITGPADAKMHLVRHIKDHDAKLAARIAGIESIDHPSDGQLLAHARTYFKDDRQELPRVR